MSRIRLWCLWLVMLALPLQGFAAVTQLYCAAASGQAAVVRLAQGAGPDAAHAGHDHSAYQHASAQPADSDSGGVDGQPADHQCALCAYCGHAAALSEFPKPLEFGEPVHASPPEPWVVIPAVAALVPDKPPRA